LVRTKLHYEAWKKIGIEAIIGDLTDKKSLEPLSSMNINAVIHTAALAGDWMEKSLAYKTNVEGTSNLLEICTHVARFIHISTIGVYGHKPYYNITESRKYKRSSIYENSKIEAEKQLLRKTQSNSRTKYIIIRPPTMYGENDRHLFPKLIKYVNKGSFRFIGRGRVLFPVLHAEDAARAVISSLTADIPSGSIYHLSGPETTLKEFMTILSKEMSKNPSFKTIPYYPALLLSIFFELKGKLTRKEPLIFRKRIRYLGRSRHVNIQKARKELTFFPQITPEIGIPRTLRFLQEEEQHKICSFKVSKEINLPVDVPFYIKKVFAKNF
jgi:nucleoside-diphosphate-sugar epimerase